MRRAGLRPFGDPFRKIDGILADAAQDGRLELVEPCQPQEVEPGQRVTPRRWTGSPASSRTGSRIQPRSYRKPVAQTTEVIPAA